MADFDSIRRGLQKVLNAQIGQSVLRVYDYQPQGSLDYPCLIISHMGDIAYNPILQAGGFQADLVCYLRAVSTGRQEAHKALDEFRFPNGSKSIFAAVNTDHTLDGSVNHAWVSLVTEPEQDPDAHDPPRLNEWESRVIVRLTHAVN